MEHVPGPGTFQKLDRSYSWNVPTAGTFLRGVGVVDPDGERGRENCTGVASRTNRRVAYCGSRAMQNSLVADVMQRDAQWGMTSTPGKTHRLSVPLTPEVQAVFQRLAEASGHSMGSTIAQWLNDTREAAQLMAENLERLRGAPGDLMMKVRLHTGTVEDMAELAIEDAIRRAEELELRDALTAGVRPSDARQPSADPLTPPSSNTGGKVQRRQKKGM